jgi:hypothetical protein
VPDDNESNSVMVTVKLEPGDASPETAARKLGLEPEDVDQDYGAIAIDPEEHLYVVLVNRDAAARANASGGAEGVYSNPNIEPLMVDPSDASE